MHAARNNTRKIWSKEEDTALLQLVNEHGATGHWPMINLSMGSRTGKQCRERYLNHLDPDMKKTAWTSEENDVIRDMFPEFGTKWSRYLILLPGLSDNAIKNRYHIIGKNNFESCSQIQTSTRLSHKRTKFSSGSIAGDTDADVDSTSDVTSFSASNRERLQKLLAARVVLDLEILRLEGQHAEDAHPSRSFNLVCPSSEEIFAGYAKEPVGEFDSEFDFDFGWTDGVDAAELCVAHNSTAADP